MAELSSLHGEVFFSHTGAASGHIEHALTKRGPRAVISPESFLVSKDNTLEDGEPDRARSWGTSVGKAMEQFIHH